MAKNFYDEWLETPNRIQDQLDDTLLVARDKDIPWVSTPHDVKVKLMVANHLGFATMGSNVLKSEIPVGWHTGKHRHGEEAMHILEGEGFSIIEGQRFNWHKSSTLHIPFWAAHQHFNTGDVPVLILHGMVFDLEAYLRVARIEQIETCGPNDPSTIAAMPEETSQYYPSGARAVIHLEQAPTNKEKSCDDALSFAPLVGHTYRVDHDAAFGRKCRLEITDTMTKKAPATDKVSGRCPPA